MGGLGNVAMLLVATSLFGLLGYPTAAASRGEGLVVQPAVSCALATLLSLSIQHGQRCACAPGSRDLLQDVDRQNGAVPTGSSSTGTT